MWILHYLSHVLQGSPVEPATLLDVSGAVPSSVVQELLAACRQGQFDRVQAEVTDSIADGWPVNPARCTALQFRRTCCLQMLMINVRRARRYDCPATTKPEQMPDSGAYSLSLANAVNAHPSVGVPMCILSSLTRRTLREGRNSLNVVRG